MHPTLAHEFFMIIDELLHGKYQNVSLIISGHGNTNTHKQIHASAKIST